MTANIIFAVVFGIIVVSLVVWVVTIFRRANRVTSASDARLTARLYAAASELPTTPAEGSAESGAVAGPPELPLQNPLLNPLDAPPSGPKEKRLAELAGLHDRGLISDEELTAARSKILAE
jgi:Short C-terminal domain